MPRVFPATCLRAPGERFDALRVANECEHHENAECKQQRLQAVGGGIAEVEQDRERPAAGEGRTEHLGADEDRSADHGDHAWPDDLAGGALGGLQSHGLSCALGAAISPKSAALSSAKGAQKSPIACYSWSKGLRR